MSRIYPLPSPVAHLFAGKKEFDHRTVFQVFHIRELR